MASRSSMLPYLRRTPSLWIGAFLVLPGLIFGLIGSSLAISDARFAADGATAQGIVLSKDIKHATSSSGTSYSIRYRFTLPDDRAFEGSSDIEVHDWERLVERGPVTIQYLVSDPSSNRLPTTGYLVWEVLLLGLAAGVLIVGGYFIRRGSRTLLEDRRLLRVGTTARATVTAVEPTNFWINRRVQWEISYSYRDAGGQDHEARSWMMPETEARAFGRGGHAAILYDPERPAQSLWLHQEWQAHPGSSAVDAAGPGSDARPPGG